MANPLDLPTPNIQTGVIGGGTLAPNPLDFFTHNFLAARQQKSSESAETRRHTIEIERLKLLQKDLDFRQEQERTKQTNADAEGGALQQYLKAITPLAEQQAQYTPPGQMPPALAGIAGMMGIPSQNAQQGGPAPAQAPNVPQGGPPSHPDPMQVFTGIVQKLPPAAAIDFVKQFGGVAQQAQAKRDQARALDEADRLTRGILTPQQADQMRLARTLAESGAPEKLWQSMLPSAQIDLAKGLEDVRALKDRREADRLATKQLQRLGLSPSPKQGMDEIVVVGASKILADYVADVRRDARKAGIEAAKTAREDAVKGLEGSALEIAAMNPDWGPAQIKRALKATPAYATLGDGEISKAAFEAPKKVQNLTAPANETVAKARVVYGPGRAALATVNAMAAKGEALGLLARGAQVTDLQGATALGGIGGAVGALGGLPLAGVGAVPAGIVGAGIGAAAGTFGAGAVRGTSRALMSPDQQRLWTAAQSLAATIYRPESGAAVTQEEVRQTLERYIPLSTDKPATRQLKQALRNELDKTLANISGLPQQLGKPILDALLSKQEQALTNGTSW